MRAASLSGLSCFALAGVVFVGAYGYYLRMLCCGGWVSAGGDPLTILPPFGIVFLVLGAWLLLIGAGKFKGSRVNIRTILPLVLAGSLVTLGTGLVLVGATVTPGVFGGTTTGFRSRGRLTSS